MLMEPDGIEMGEQVDRHPRKTRWGVGRTGGADGTGRTPVSEASGVPAKAGLRTEATPLEEPASSPYCWWMVGYPGRTSGRDARSDLSSEGQEQKLPRQR